MIQIMIVEDNVQIGEGLAKLIEAQSMKFHVSYASNYEMAMKMIQGSTKFDLFFLDINLQDDMIGDQSGYDLAESIRGMVFYSFTPIVFITSMEQYEITVHRGINYCRFLTKPFSREKIRQILFPFTHGDMHKMPQNNTWVVRCNSIYHTIDLSDVIYVEAQRRGVIIHLSDDNLELNYMGLSKCKEELEERGFLQCHRSYLLNAQYISSVDIINRVAYINYKNKVQKIDIGVRFVDQIRMWIDAIRTK